LPAETRVPVPIGIDAVRGLPVAAPVELVPPAVGEGIAEAVAGCPELVGGRVEPLVMKAQARIDGAARLLGAHPEARVHRCQFARRAIDVVRRDRAEDGVDAVVHARRFGQGAAVRALVAVLQHLVERLVESLKALGVALCARLRGQQYERYGCE